MEKFLSTVRSVVVTLFAPVAAVDLHPTLEMNGGRCRCRRSPGRRPLSILMEMSVTTPGTVPKTTPPLTVSPFAWTVELGGIRDVGLDGDVVVAVVGDDAQRMAHDAGGDIGGRDARLEDFDGRGGVHGSLRDLDRAAERERIRARGYR